MKPKAGSLIPGVEQDFGGGVVLTIPPLTIGSLQRLQSKIEALQKSASSVDPASLQTIVEAAHAALRRNYPDITAEEVADLIDVGNMHEIIACVLDVAGLRRKQAADAKNPQAPSMEGAAPSTGPT